MKSRGGELGAGYLTANCPEKIQADFAINEGAPHPLSFNGKVIYFIQVRRKGNGLDQYQSPGSLLPRFDACSWR